MAFLVAFITFSFLPVAFSNATTSPGTVHGNWINSTVTFNTYGQFSVNETLYQTINSTNSLSSFTLGFPQAFQGHIADLEVRGQTGNSSVSVSESTGVGPNQTVTMSLSISPALPAGQNSSVELGFYVLNTFVSVADGNYSAPILFSPAVSIPVDYVVSAIVLPYLTTHIVDPNPMMAAGFSHTVGTNATLETWNYSGNNVSSVLRYNNVTIYSDPQSSGAIDFTKIIRQLSLSPNGQVIVTDTLNLKNNGENTIYSLDYSPLTNASALTAVPNTEPPISNLGTISISGGVLDLNGSGTISSPDEAIQPDSAVSLVYQYPLGQQYWNYSNGEYHVSIPNSAPIDAIIDQYSISSSSAPGVLVDGNQLSLSGVNTTTISGPNATLTFHLGIASAFGSALPAAGLLFIAVFIGAVVFRPKQESKEDSGSIFDTLSRAIEDKVSGTNEILSELKTKGNAVARNDLIVARSRIDDFRIKTNSKVGTLRAQLTGATAGVQAGFNEVLATDREFDRVVKDMLNNYEQLITKRMKEDTFTRLQHNNERRLQGITNSLIDRIHDLREEYEEEA